MAGIASNHYPLKVSVTQHVEDDSESQLNTVSVNKQLTGVGNESWNDSSRTV
jgi:hypothetical protein